MPVTHSAIERIQQRPMGSFQVSAVAICMVLNMGDGFDVLAMAFTAPQIADDWALSPERLGILFSAGLVGMMLGSLLLAPLADQYGRRWGVLTSLVIVTLGMFFSAFCSSVIELGIMRFITGVGVGTMLPSINTMVAEYASLKRRNLSIAVVGTGYPMGATLGGVVAIFLMARYGWPSVYLFGAITSALMIPVVYYRLPESLEYLLAKRPPGALEKINRVMVRLGEPPLTSLPETMAVKTRKIPVLDTLAPDIRINTLLFCSAFFLLMISFYFVMSWTPQLLVQAGLSLQEGISGGVLLNLGGMVGQLLFGFTALRFGARRVILLQMTLAAVVMAGFSFVGTELIPLLVLAFLVGLSLFGAMTGLYALAPQVFSAELRNTGTGMAIGLGRMGAVCGPLIAGFLLAASWSPADSYLVFALPVIAAGLILCLIRFGSGKPEATPVS